MGGKVRRGSVGRQATHGDLKHEPKGGDPSELDAR